MKKLLVVAFVLCGCAQVPLQRITADANLVITRSSQFQAGGVTDRVTIDNEPPVLIDRGQIIFFKLADGQHIIRVSNNFGTLYAGDGGGYPITIKHGTTIRLVFEHGGFGKAMIPIFGLLAQPEITFEQQN